jgi:hypothetical protein
MKNKSEQQGDFLMRKMYKIKNGETEVTCETAREALELVRLFKEEEERERAASAVPMVRASKILAPTNPWTGQQFWKFVESLGDSQRGVLKLLLKHGRISDDKLRRFLNVESNQQLAGVLSGISKQAAAQDISARAVFTIDNETKSGETTKTYVASHVFTHAAEEYGWPEN